MQTLNLILIVLIIVVIIYHIKCRQHDDDDHHDHVKQQQSYDDEVATADSAGITEAWQSLTDGGEMTTPAKKDDVVDDDDAQLRQALRATLRDGVTAVEDNLVDLSDEVKNAFTVPSATDIRQSADRARSMMLPEISTRKVDGMGGSVQLYKGRDPAAMVEVKRDAPEWGVTDAWLYQKEQAAAGR